MKKLEIDDNIKQYFKEIKNYKPLSMDEEKRIFLEYQKTGDTKYRDLIINSNLKYAVSVAKRYINRGVQFSELISEANSGLFVAIDKFNPEKFNNKFFTYATHWIEFKIKDRIAKESVRYENIIDRNYSVDNSSILEPAFFGNDEKDMYVCDDKSIINMEDGDDFSIQTDTVCTKMINALFSELDEREVTIINMSYGTNNSDMYTLEEMSQKLDISQERCRQIREKALLKMQSIALEQNMYLPNF